MPVMWRLEQGYFTVMAPDERLMTPAEAYEAAYRFVWQYAEREPNSVSLQLMLVAMEPAARTNDPASWDDWLRCVDQVRQGPPVPRFPTVYGRGDAPPE